MCSSNSDSSSRAISHVSLSSMCAAVRYCVFGVQAIDEASRSSLPYIVRLPGEVDLSILPAAGKESSTTATTTPPVNGSAKSSTSKQNGLKIRNIVAGFHTSGFFTGTLSWLRLVLQIPEPTSMCFFYLLLRFGGFLRVWRSRERCHGAAVAVARSPRGVCGLWLASHLGSRAIK